MKSAIFLLGLFMCSLFAGCEEKHYANRRDFYHEIYGELKYDGIVCAKERDFPSGNCPATRICSEGEYDDHIHSFIEPYGEERGLYHIVEIGDSVHKDTGTTIIYIYKPRTYPAIKYDLMTVCDIWDSIEKRDREYSKNHRKP